jgi:acyl carrier protein
MMLMDENDFIESMLSVCASRDEAIMMLDTPIESLSLDSLDLEILRTTLEKRRGEPIHDDLWQTVRTLRDLMSRL